MKSKGIWMKNRTLICKWKIRKIVGIKKGKLREVCKWLLQEN
ncbi:phage protein [Staphylococcus aureus subsp. aureus TW20]|nr:phage protein [Staphylococcus aureus subsp. aureus TW20]